MLFFSFLSQQYFEWTIIVQNIGFEPYGVISWPQVTWDNALHCSVLCFAFLQFFKIFHVRLGKKKEKISF